LAASLIFTLLEDALLAPEVRIIDVCLFIVVYILQHVVLISHLAKPVALSQPQRVQLPESLRHRAQRLIAVEHLSKRLLPSFMGASLSEGVQIVFGYMRTLLGGVL